MRRITLFPHTRIQSMEFTHTAVKLAVVLDWRGPVAQVHTYGPDAQNFPCQTRKLTMTMVFLHLPYAAHSTHDALPCAPMRSHATHAAVPRTGTV